MTQQSHSCVFTEENVQSCAKQPSSKLPQTGKKPMSINRKVDFKKWYICTVEWHLAIKNDMYNNRGTSKAF